jgi:hypothetical protein
MKQLPELLAPLREVCHKLYNCCITVFTHLPSVFGSLYAVQA